MYPPVTLAELVPALIELGSASPRVRILRPPQRGPRDFRSSPGARDHPAAGAAPRARCRAAAIEAVLRAVAPLLRRRAHPGRGPASSRWRPPAVRDAEQPRPPAGAAPPPGGGRGARPDRAPRGAPGGHGGPARVCPLRPRPRGPTSAAPASQLTRVRRGKIVATASLPLGAVRPTRRFPPATTRRPERASRRAPSRSALTRRRLPPGRRATRSSWGWAAPSARWPASPPRTPASAGAPARAPLAAIRRDRHPGAAGRACRCAGGGAGSRSQGPAQPTSSWPAPW